MPVSAVLLNPTPLDRSLTTPLIPELAVRELYLGLARELAEQRYSPAELTMFMDDLVYYGRFLKRETTAYAMEAVTRNITRAAGYLGLDRRPQRILDLGSGLGMQSIIFAAMGSSVLAVDRDPRANAITRKRIAYYERQLGRPLAIDLLEADFTTLDPLPWASSCDAMFSQSAFSHMPPLSGTVDKIAAILKPNARVYVWDINPRWLGLPPQTEYERQLPTPRQVARAFADANFAVDVLSGGTAVPRQVWRVAPAKLCSAVGRAACALSPSLAFTFVLGAQRTAAMQGVAMQSAAMQETVAVA